MAIELTEKQSEAWGWLGSDSSLLSLLYGGAKGGGKSFFLCVWACYMAKNLANLWSIQPSDNPVVVGFIGRKRGVDFWNTTLATWKRVIPSHHYEIKEQKKQIIIDGRVAISFGGLDDQETIEKFNSAEFAFACIDQAEETDESDVSVLFGALRLRLNGITPPYRMLYTANPRECWLKSKFPINAYEPDKRVRTENVAGHDCKFVYVPALYTDNQHLPDNYTATLEMAFGYDQALLTAYKSGDWSLARDSEFVVTRNMLDKLKDFKRIDGHDIITAACDPAIGGDECVMYVLKNGEKIAEKIIHETDTMVIASEFVTFCRAHEVPAYAAGIDTCGLGIGIGNRCHQLGYHCRFINSAEKANDPRCKTVRDEVWLTLREAVERKDIAPLTDEVIIKQITAFKFKTENGLFRVLLKAGVKSAIGSSPDRGDAFAYAVYMINFAKSEKMRQTYKRFERKSSGDWRDA